MDRLEQRIKTFDNFSVVEFKLFRENENEPFLELNLYTDEPKQPHNGSGLTAAGSVEIDLDHAVSDVHLSKIDREDILPFRRLTWTKRGKKKALLIHYHADA